MNLIAMAIYEIPKKFAEEECILDTLIKKQGSQRIKKVIENENMKEIATERPYIENIYCRC